LEKQMSKRLKLGLMAAVLVVVAILATIGALIVIQQHLPFFERHVTPPSSVRGDFAFFYLTNTIISSINIALLILLILNYTSIYIKTRSPFTIGLLIFAFVFLVRDVTSSPFITAMYGFRAYGLGPFAFLPSMFELVALSVLLYLSVKY